MSCNPEVPYINLPFISHKAEMKLGLDDMASGRFTSDDDLANTIEKWKMPLNNYRVNRSNVAKANLRDI